MLLELLVRATDLLEEISAISGSAYKVEEDIPGFQNDYDGFVAWWGDATWTQERRNETQHFFAVIMPGFLQSPQLVPGMTYKTRKFMMQYADLITQKFIERPRLESSSHAPLNGVQDGTGFTGGNIRTVTYPDSNNQIVRYRYSFTLTVVFIRSKVC
jgi:hypothetical protein